MAALTLVTPENGATVPVLREAQKAYLAQDVKARAAAMDGAETRTKLARVGGLPAALELRWQGGKAVEASLGIGPDGGETQTFAVTNPGVAYITNLEVARRYRWHVTCAGETAEGVFTTADEAPRLLYVKGLSNVRDLGGRRGLDGRRIRQGRIIRSDGLRDSTRKEGDSLFGGRTSGGRERIAAEGKVSLAVDLGVKTEIELRRAREIVGFSSSVLGDGVSWRHIEFTAYDLVDDPMNGRLPFAEIFRILLDAESYPILFHCSGGRDRSGTLAYLLQALLGVGREDLRKDWEVSAFADDGLSFNSSLIARLERYIEGLPGADFRAKAEAFARSCGISDAEIAAFRELMLEGRNG